MARLSSDVLFAAGTQCSRLKALRHLMLRRFPGVEAARQVRNVAEAGTTQNTRRDGTAIAAFAVHDQKFLAIQFGKPGIQASQRDAS
jgi:hypothetical protein